VIGFFSFTEVTDPAAHGAYNEWHLLDHMPEQFSIEGIQFGQRWACTPECLRARVFVSPLLERCHYMTLYLMRDAGVLPEFFALARELHDADRFFDHRHAHLSGPFDIEQRWVAPRVRISAAAVPFRPSKGIYAVVGPPVDGAAMVELDGVAGAWQFVATPGATTGDPPDPAQTPRHITIAFIDGDLAATAEALGGWCLAASLTAPATAQTLEWAGPLARIDPDFTDSFARLTP
jgi:hypothetical protein